MTDVCFALAATQILHEQRIARAKRRQRQAVRWLIVAGLVLLLLSSLLCTALVFFCMALHTSPY